MRGNNELYPIEQLFSSYNKMKTEISLLEISLKNTVLTDDEIESMSLYHPVGANDCGKSSVFNTSQKVADIAISAEGRISRERKDITKRIALLTNAVQQIEVFIGTLADIDKQIFDDRYIQKKSRTSLVAEYGVEGKNISLTTFSKRVKDIKSAFYDITPLTSEQMIAASGKYKGYYGRGNDDE
jgi:hypothetical protein